MLTQDPDQVIAPSAMTEDQLVAAIENRMQAAHLALQSYFLQLAIEERDCGVIHGQSATRSSSGSAPSPKRSPAHSAGSAGSASIRARSATGSPR